MKPYRLLRNNKETGPYSAEDLIAMGLKAYDLVWLDGKSAAWRYPCEIAELKPYAPVAEDLAASLWKPAPNSVTAAKLSISANDVTNSKSTISEKITKPRIRISADWNKIPDPVKTPVAESEPAAPVTAPAQVYKQVQTATVPAGDDKAAPQIKYTESLDSIKQRYNETVLNRSGRSVPFSYYWLLLLIPALGLGMWLGSGIKKQQPVVAGAASTAAPEAAPATTGAVSLAAAMEDNVPVDQPTETNTDPQTTATQPALADNNIPVTQNKNTPVSGTVHTQETKSVKHTSVVPATHAAVKPAAKQALPVKIKAPASSGNVTNGSAQKGKPAATVKPETQISNTTTPLNTTTASTPAKKEAAPVSDHLPVVAPAGKRISDYVSVKEELQQGETGKQMKLHVKNNTNTPVDLVVLDLQYYDGNGKFKKGETLYVNHLSANNAVALNAPDIKNAQRIDYKVSLLSIEKNNVYLIAE